MTEATVAEPLPIIPIPEIQTHNKLDTATLRKQITDVLKFRYPDFGRLSMQETGKEAVVLCGGPTVDGLVDRIKQLRQGRILIAIDRMQAWCHTHDLVPDYVLGMDGSGDFNALSYQHLDPYTTYVIATQCGKPVAECLKTARTYIISSVHENLLPKTEGDKVVRETAEDGEPPLMAVYKSYGYPSYTTLNGGSNVGLTAMLMATVMGMRTIHVFGYDCHRGDNEQGYASGLTGGYPGVQHDPNNNFEAIVEGRVFKTTHAYWAGAQQFFTLMNFLLKNKTIDHCKLYGDSACIALCGPENREWLRGDCNLQPVETLSPGFHPLIGSTNGYAA